MLKVFISEPAKESFRAIYKYYKAQGYPVYAQRIRKAVISRSKSLSKNPYKGQEKEFLKPLIRGTGIYL